MGKYKTRIVRAYPVNNEVCPRTSPNARRPCIIAFSFLCHNNETHTPRHTPMAPGRVPVMQRLIRKASSLLYEYQDTFSWEYTTKDFVPFVPY